MTIQLFTMTPDLKRLRAFYESLFDAREVQRHPERGEVFFVNLRIGSSALGLVAQDADLTAPQRTAIAVMVEDVDSLLPRVEELGGEVLGPPNDMPWGHRVAHVHDPDGNLVNLTQEIAAPH